MRALCVDTFNRRLAVDINRLNVAQDKNDVTIVKQTEENLSRGLILLSQVLKENLTMERECILTAFSLTPTEVLLKHLTQLAERSGFVNMGLTQTNSANIDDVEPVEPLEKVPVPLQLNCDDFETVCDLEIASLKNKGFRHGRSKFRANANVQEKVERNLEGLVSIQVRNYFIQLTKAKSFFTLSCVTEIAFKFCLFMPLSKVFRFSFYINK